jgi:DNA-binding GntR family transcriptional regulator
VAIAERPTDKRLFWELVQPESVGIDPIQRAVLECLTDVGGSATDFELSARIGHPRGRVRQAIASLNQEHLVQTGAEGDFLVVSLTSSGRRYVKP